MKIIEGARDYLRRWPGIDNDIKHLIVSSTKYVVFVDKELDVDWMCDDNYKHKSEKEHNHILNDIADIESIPNDHLRDKIRLNYKRMIGEALARSFDGDYQNAEDILEKAKDYISKRNIEASRGWFLFSSGIIGVFFMFLILIFWLMRTNIIPFLGINAYALILAFFFGGVGAFLSIVLRIGSSRLDSSSGKWLHYLEGTSRIVAGSISGLLLAILVRIGIVFPVIQNIEYIYYVYIAVAIIGGASERWAPTVAPSVKTVFIQI